MKKLVSNILAGVLVMASVISLSEGAIEAESSSYNLNPSCPVVQIHYPNAQTANRDCPSPYTNILGECFYIHMYEPYMNWQEAKIFCKQAGGKLAEPKHFGAIIAHLYTIPRIVEMVLENDINRLWLGGNRSDTSKPFKWLVSGDRIDYPIEDEETVFSSAPGNCLMVFMRKSMPFYLRGNDCNTRFHFVCQLP